jgi:hypothetical protein
MIHKGSSIAHNRLLGYDGVMFEHASATEIATWVALIFLTGFIGFFGKALGRAILLFFQKKKGDVPAGAVPSVRVPPSGEGLSLSTRTGLDTGDTPSNDQQKLIKKSMKAQVKAQKKREK